MKKLTFLTVIIAAVFFIANPAFSGMPASKATAQFTNLEGVTLGPSGDAWTTVLEQKIKTPNKKDLFIDASFEVGLTTNTAVMSKKLQRVIANAVAQVKVRVVLDPGPGQTVVAPGEVVFAMRDQTLVAEFAGLYDLDCITVNSACLTCELVGEDPQELVCNSTPIDENYTEDDCEADDGFVYVTGVTISDADECYDAEYLQLILKTLAAHSFNFIAVDVETGVHTIAVQVQLDYDLGDGVDIYDRPNLLEQTLSWGASGSFAWIGKGSVTIESVRMIKYDEAGNPPVVVIED